MFHHDHWGQLNFSTITPDICSSYDPTKLYIVCYIGELLYELLHEHTPLVNRLIALWIWHLFVLPPFIPVRSTPRCPIEFNSVQHAVSYVSKQMHQKWEQNLYYFFLRSVCQVVNGRWVEVKSGSILIFPSSVSFTLSKEAHVNWVWKER